MAKSRKITRAKIKRSIRLITEAQIVRVIYVISPWVTPLITAWLVFDATQKHLGWSVARAFMGAAIVETNGIASTNLLLYLYQKEVNKKALSIGFGIVGAYVTSILFLTLALDTFPELSKLAPIVFVVLVLSSYATVAVRTYARVSTTKARRVTGLRKVAQPVAQGYRYESENEDDKIEIIGQTSRERLSYLLNLRPDKRFESSDKLAKLIGCSGANIRSIATKNGDGWKVEAL